MAGTLIRYLSLAPFTLAAFSARDATGQLCTVGSVALLSVDLPNCSSTVHFRSKEALPLPQVYTTGH